VVIPNYNGDDLLRENLPTVLEAFRRWGGPFEVIVVDDCSSDGSLRTLSELFPSVRVVANAANQGFSRTSNRGMTLARYPVAFCINTDVRVDEGLVEPVLSHFADPDVFAVTPNILAEREGKNQGIVAGLYGKGFIKGGFAPLATRSGVRENLYCIGACVAYDLEKFRDLGGYDEIYTPYLFEDVDISYRAWKRGWKSLYEPGATVHHLSSATIGKTGRRRKRAIYFRNRFLFHWINLADPPLIAANLLHTLFRLAVSFLWLDMPYYRAFWGALRRIGAVTARRRAAALSHLLGDREILRRTSGANP
jgi:GT2 family glycosyltransferase